MVAVEDILPPDTPAGRQSAGVPRKAVVVGGLGMIGSAVARDLLSRGTAVVIADIHQEPDLRHITSGRDCPLLSYQRCDVRDLPRLIGVTSGADQVYHFAGELGTSDMDDDIRGAIETNVKGTLNVLDACVLNRVPLMFNPTKPQVWLNTYTVTKTCTEQFCRLYNRLHADRLRVVQLRYYNAYGRDQHLFPVRKIVPAFALQAMHGLPVEVFGAGEQTVDMIHVDDMARITVDITSLGWTQSVPDCGSAEELTVNRVAEMVNEWYGNRSGVRHLPMRRGEDPHTRLVADLSELRQALGAEPAVRPFRDGLAQTLRYMESIPRRAVDEAMKFYGWGPR